VIDECFQRVTLSLVVLQLGASCRVGVGPLVPRRRYIASLARGTQMSSLGVGS
jgi:hypothetical protein